MSFETAAARVETAGQARSFTLLAKALAATGGSRAEAADFLREKHPNLRALPDFTKALTLRAAVPAATLGGWGSGLVALQDYSAAFLAEIEPLTAFGQLPVTAVPSDIRVPRDTSEIVATWVPEGAASPVYQGSFGTETLPGDPKIAAGLVITKELARDARPAAQKLFSGKLRYAAIRGSDLAAFDPSIAATAGHPASLTHGAPSVPSSGLDPDEVAADLAALRDLLAGFPVSGRAYVASPEGAEFLASLRYPGGVPAFPNAGAAGGDILGVPLIVSDGCGPQVVLGHWPSVLVSDDGIAVDASEQGTMEMVVPPVANSGVPTPATQLVSLFQTDSVALKVTRFLNFIVGRPGAVARLSGFPG